MILLFNYDSFISAASCGVDDFAVSMAHLHIWWSVQVGCGSVTLDFLAAVATYPKPDDKTRSTSSKVIVLQYIDTRPTILVSQVIVNIFRKLYFDMRACAHWK